MKRIVALSFCMYLFAATLSAAEGTVRPFPSFLYDGKTANIADFKAETLASESDENAAFDKIAYTAPDGRLRLTVDYRVYKNFPVHEYSVTLENASASEQTALVEHFKSFDAVFALPESGQQITLNMLRGSTCSPEDFTPIDFPLANGQMKEFRTPCGRSSNDFIPFLDLNFGEKAGWIIAVGWTGAWAADVTHDGENVRVVAGMDKTRFRLKPGESIRQPSLTVFKRIHQTRRAFKTVVHRFMVDQKSPRTPDGKIVTPIFAVTAGGGNKTPQMMLDVLDYALKNNFGFNTYWVDAGWYGAPHEDEHESNCGPNWWTYAGDWRVNTTTHPTGDLLPIADAVHKAGLRFLLWFEPERITDSAPILAEHPDYRHGQLVDYGNPDALAWIQETIYAIIEKHKIDIYRQDFNIDPGPIWAEMDQANPDRVGMAEARHITGMYRFLDEMKMRFPNIAQENCASGGRRLDIEMISRAYPYCRSDYPIGQKPGDTALVFSQNATLNTLPFIPFQGSETNCAPLLDDYAILSCFSTGTVFTPTDMDGGIIRRPFTAEETAWFKKWFAVCEKMLDCSFGDFYPLTDETSAANDVWCAWQFHDPQNNKGYAVAFRRADAPEQEKIFALSRIDPNADYQIETPDGTKSTVSGSDLAAWKVSQSKRSGTVLFYQKKQ